MQQQHPQLSVPQHSFRRSVRRGAKIVVAVADNGHVSKLAVAMARALLRPRDELQLLTVVLGEDNLQRGTSMLAGHVQPGADQAGSTTPVVLVKGDGRLGDVIHAYAAGAGADLLVVGSQYLCVDGSRGDPLPASGSFALRLVKLVRCCPVLVVKANTRGPYARSGSTSLGVKVMVECRSNSRHMLAWLMDQLAAEKDSIFLAVTKAYDVGTGHVREAASRMLTNFSVQAGTEAFYTAQRLFKEASCKALPQAVDADGIDILAVQAPDCKQLPDGLLSLLQDARTSVLVFNQRADDGWGASAAAAEQAAEAAMAGAGTGGSLSGGRRRNGLPRVTI